MTRSSPIMKSPNTMKCTMTTGEKIRIALRFSFIWYRAVSSNLLNIVVVMRKKASVGQKNFTHSGASFCCSRNRKRRQSLTVCQRRAWSDTWRSFAISSTLGCPRIGTATRLGPSRPIPTLRRMLSWLPKHNRICQFWWKRLILNESKAWIEVELAKTPWINLQSPTSLNDSYDIAKIELTERRWNRDSRTSGGCMFQKRRELTIILSDIIK